MNDFHREPLVRREQMAAAVQRVMESGWFVLGREVEMFEKAWGSACKAAECVGVANGLDSIEISLRALGIGAGDEVITSPMSAFASVLGIIRAGACPVLADIQPETGLLCPASVARCIGPRCRAVMLVHLYGQLRDMDQWLDICNRFDLFLVEDCAQAHLATWRGRSAGTFGMAGAYSFYPTKNLGALGDAGAVITQDKSLASRARVLRNYGQHARYHHSLLGLNSRLDELQAAILMARLPWLADDNRKRHHIAELYREGIRHPNITLLGPPQDEAGHVNHLFVVLSDDREKLQAHLAQHGVQTLIHYPVPAHLQAPCTSVRRDPLGLTQSERHGRMCLSLPCHPNLRPEEVHEVIRACNTFERV